MAMILIRIVFKGRSAQREAPIAKVAAHPQVGPKRLLQALGSRPAWSFDSPDRRRCTSGEIGSTDR